MIDHLAGRPSPSWKRTQARLLHPYLGLSPNANRNAQVFLVIFFWAWRLALGNANAPRILWLRKINRYLKRFTPWQIIVSVLTTMYAARNIDKILGLGAPEPLARLYSPSYYRATWIVTGLDAGFATAMSIRPKWLKDFCSILFSVYYIIYATEADEKLRRFRAVPTVEMLRVTWEKTTNPYLRIAGYRPSLTLRRKFLLPRPARSAYDRPITVHIFFAPALPQLAHATDLILDFPGGGFIAMTPEHHEDRLRLWAIRTGLPVLAVDYGKAPEYPYPFAIDECFDLYRLLVETNGKCVGMSGQKLNIIMSGDSAGATIAVGTMVRILEHNQFLTPSTSASATTSASTSPSVSPSTSMSAPMPHPNPNPQTLPHPRAIVLNYAALDFNFTSWMSPAHLAVLRSEQSSGNLPGLRELASQKDHLQHVSPLSMVGDGKSKKGKGKAVVKGRKRASSATERLKRHTSWRDIIRDFAGGQTQGQGEGEGEGERKRGQTEPQPRTQSSMSAPNTISKANAERKAPARPLLRTRHSESTSSLSKRVQRRSSVKSFTEPDSGFYYADEDTASDDSEAEANEEDEGYAEGSSASASASSSAGPQTGRTRARTAPASSHARREEDRPLAERVRYVYSGTSTLKPTASTLEQRQEELEAAVAAADVRAAGKGKGKEPMRGEEYRGGKSRASEPIGTRLTMTSRTGFFQDRIISPSMMRAMAIMYIGPHRNPDFATDYRISPILTPHHLLAQFPPLLMQCGEKDPFVDDTVIFAGRVREAKRARKVELDMKLGGKSARFGEGLRMTPAGGAGGAGGATAAVDGDRAKMIAERDRLARETEDDWVQMVIFEDWSHGYLQMMALMDEAREVTEDLADWIVDAFGRLGAEPTAPQAPPSESLVDAATVPEPMDTPASTTDKRTRRNTPPLVNSPRPIAGDSPTATRAANGTTPQLVKGYLDVDPESGGDETLSPSESSTETETVPVAPHMEDSPSPFASETEGDGEDSAITFVPKTKRRQSSTGSAGSTGASVGGGTPVARPGSGHGTARRTSDEGTALRLQAHAHAHAHGLHTALDGVRQDLEQNGQEVAESSDENGTAKGNGSPKEKTADTGAGSSGSTPRGKPGTRISETELMRRRRLLDAHVFE
ncbi:alpha beta-hydrolase [Coniophora puteana RWD-64-598 SS2]|uniref:Alpha beta-hydrolase n=1 Tax=Coniophora puteana (strain RWD-64-598) TaxID=741705 RepID=A0A5M3MVM5_CONPW|nr:alpha beta-hydrolase [Coniophora puteana RWD-64-598 SS2]EIW82765.1 alpha beta-hydrolase [Coniophora puteana RWD-64-598 SS2]